MSYDAPHTVLNNQRYIIYDLMKEHTRPGSVVIDVGAQTGQEARFLALHIGASGHIYSFEPVPHLAQRIKDWMAGITSTGMTQESLGNITLIEKAVHCVGGQKKTFLQDDNHVPASSFIKECIDAWKGAPQFGGILTDYTEITVETVALDDLFSNKRLDFIKCDAEGADPYVLLGAQNIINSNKCPLIFEWNSVPDGLSDWSFSYLTSLGYSIYTTNNKTYQSLDIDLDKWSIDSYRKHNLDKCLKLCSRPEDIYVGQRKIYNLFCICDD